MNIRQKVQMENHNCRSLKGYEMMSSVIPLIRRGISDQRHRVQVFVLLLSLVRGVLPYAVAPASTLLPLSTSWTTSSALSEESSPVTSTLAPASAALPSSTNWKTSLNVFTKSVSESSTSTLTSVPIPSSTNWRTASTLKDTDGYSADTAADTAELSSVSSNVSVLSRCVSNNGAWQSPCGISRRSVHDSDIETGLLGIQLFINDTINDDIFNMYIKSFAIRRRLQDSAVEMFPRAFNSSSLYQAKLITVLKYLHTFVANVDYMSNCGLTNVVETSLKTRLDSLNTRIFRSVCECVIAVRETGINYVAASQESLLSPKILQLLNSDDDELSEIRLLYFVLSDTERVIGLIKPWFAG